MSVLMQLYRNTILLLLLCYLVSPHAYASPNFNVFDIDQKPVAFEQLLADDRWTLIQVWAYHCGVCRAETPKLSSFQQQQDQQQQPKVKVLGLSIDGVKDITQAKQFIDQTKASYVNYVVDLLTFSSYYTSVTKESFRGTPTYLLYSPEGKLMGNNPGAMRLSAVIPFIERMESNQTTGQ